MKKSNRLISILGVLFLLLLGCDTTSNTQNENNANRGLPNPNSWYNQISFTCESKGYTISILRKSTWQIGDSPYKIQLQYHSTIATYCKKARRDILANAYSISPIFYSYKVSSNALWGEYCDNTNQWIIGDVYYVVYPNSVTNSGPFTTNILHNSTIHLDIMNINELVTLFNQRSSFSAPTCSDPSCPDWDDNVDPSNGDDPYETYPNGRYYGSRDFIKKIKKMLSEDVRYIEPQSKGNGGIIIIPDISDPDFLEDKSMVKQ